MAFPSGRHFLQIPGPTNVPDRVLRAIDRPTIDHRGPEFAKLAKEVLAGLQSVFRTTQPVIVYPASGTGAWEAALFVRGDYNNQIETTLTSATFPIVTTSNDEIVGYVLRKPGGDGVGPHTPIFLRPGQPELQGS